MSNKDKLEVQRCGNCKAYPKGADKTCNGYFRTELDWCNKYDHEQEKHTHGDDCGCVYCEQGAKAAAYFKESRKLEPDAYKDLSGLDLTDMFSTCGDIKTETHPIGTVDGLRAELEQVKDWADKLYDVGMDGIDYVGMSNYASRQSEAKSNLRITYDKGKAIRGKSAQPLPPHISQ